MARPKLDPTATPTTDRILGAAEVAFAESGFDRARLADMAKAAGIRRPSLLYHFESKQVLYEAVVRRSFDRLGGALVAAMALPGGVTDRVTGLMQAFLDFLAADPHFAPLLLREMLDEQGPGRELLLTHVSPLLDQLEAFLADEEGIRDVPTRAAITQLAVSALVREACGPLREPLFGSGEPFPALARALLLEDR